ncbi:MAG: carbon starvation protein A [Bacteroidales bacterium]|nr:carbon starvation protein A [Bacteroidales bacterium]
MITFILSIVLLLAGYFFYSKLVSKIFGVDASRPTPAYTKQDGIDYIPMKSWRIFLIQFLNIAGLGPIFGAIMGAQFGTASFLWIVFGSIFAGATHDYLAGMISLRNGGMSLPEIHGKYLGNGVKQVMRVFSVFMMILVGVVFLDGPAKILSTIIPQVDVYIWIIIIFIYYIVATLLPINKIIGKIYPVFGSCLLFMALGILISILIKQPHLPEIWEGLENKMPNADSTPIFPMMFISIACGAISGFHATQSPLMARCMTNEKQGRPIFYGTMIAEGIVALIWAAAASYFFFDPSSGKENIDASKGAAVIVDYISRNWLGTAGAILTMLGVVFAPITSGDTALRSGRLIVADFLKYDQKSIKNRLVISIPIFAITAGILVWEIKDAEGFDMIWRYFAWANQVLSVPTLWAITIYLAQKRKVYIITLIPALFMTMVCTTFILIAKKEGFGLPENLAYCIAGFITLVLAIVFFAWKRKYKTEINEETINIK